MSSTSKYNININLSYSTKSKLILSWTPNQPKILKINFFPYLHYKHTKNKKMEFCLVKCCQALCPIWSWFENGLSLTQLLLLSLRYNYKEATREVNTWKIGHNNLTLVTWPVRHYWIELVYNQLRSFRRHRFSFSALSQISLFSLHSSALIWLISFELDLEEWQVLFIVLLQNAFSPPPTMSDVHGSCVCLVIFVGQFTYIPHF